MGDILSGAELEAILEDGSIQPYVVTNNPPRGSMKHTYFAPDKSYVVQFFNDPNNGLDSNMHDRIADITGRYNPTLTEDEGGAKGNTSEMAEYFSKRFCWPVGIVKSPEFGIVCPAYPQNFIFEESASILIDMKGKEKKSNWFTSRNRKYLEKEELGDFRMMLKMSIELARSVRRMHQAGLSHSDLSNNNVLIDPKSGSCVIIDIDSLVVPGRYPPEVAGTRGYIAPEVLSTMELELDDPDRKLPSSYTDLHALPVLIYEYLLFRHPLIGPKIYSTDSAEEDDFLGLGPLATFVENPTDTSNRPENLSPTIKDLGSFLERLFIRAFVDGLHHPNERPTAMEWEKALVKTWDLLHPCPNPDCQAKWFVLQDLKQSSCPFCGSDIDKSEVLRLHLKSEQRGKSGQWMELGVVDAYHNLPLFKWHIFSNIFPDEKADRSMQAYICRHKDKWLLVNYDVTGMISPGGSLVPTGHAIHLKNGVVFRASNEENGLLIEVREGK